MGCDTEGRIKGYVKPEEVLNFIRQKWDANASNGVERKSLGPLAECSFDYKFNDHSESSNYWYIDSGYIDFKYKGEQRGLFYSYSNINTFENLAFYEKVGLSDMVKSETTHLRLGYWGSSVEIMKALVEQFNGGWVDDNDCDDAEFYAVGANPVNGIKPVIYITQEELNEKYGGVVVITK